ncbi:MAG: DUF1533 domain-containing protein [Cohnella sp.]|nr:DUF1533 domain-containing protein [Cohnella sp.]
MRKSASRTISIFLAVVLLLSSITAAPRSTHAASDSGSWRRAGGDISFGTASYTSLSVYNGKPYVAYKDSSGNGKAKMYNGSSWADLSSFGFSVGTIDYPSLYIDQSNGTPYVAYKDAGVGGTDGKATVKKYNGSSWVPVGSAGFSAGTVAYTSMFVDNGIPYAAYQDAANGNRVTVMKWNGSSWGAVGNAGFSTNQALYVSLYVYNGIPYVAYVDSGNGTSGKATVMTYNGSSWVPVGTAEFTAGLASYTSLFVSEGIPYLAFQDAANSSKATVMKYDGSNWEPVGNAGISPAKANYTTLFIESGTPYVGFQNNGGRANVMKFDGTGWATVGSADFTEYAALYLSLYIGNGIPYLAYVNYANNTAAVMKYNLDPPSLTADTTSNNVQNAISIDFADNASWRGAITAVKDGAITLSPSKYTVSSGTITFQADVLSTGNHTITVTATGYHDATVTQTIAPVLIVIEFEPPDLTADATNNDTASAIDITFEDDSTWRDAITAIKDGATTLQGTDYTVSSGKITIHAGVLSAGNHTITITSSGYTAATVAQSVTASASPTDAIAGISLDAAKFTIGVGDTHTIVVRSNDEDNSSSAIAAEDVTFATSDSTVATVNAGGVVTGVKKGTVTIGASYPSGGTTHTRFATVTVDPKSPAAATPDNPKTGAVYVSVVGPDGLAVPEATVKISQGSKVWPLAKTDSNGRVLAYVPAGTYNVLVYATNGTTTKNYAVKSLKVLAGQRSEPFKLQQLEAGAVSHTVDPMAGADKQITGSAPTGVTVIARDGIATIGTGKVDAKTGKYTIKLKTPQPGKTIAVTAIDANENEKSVTVQVPKADAVTLSAASKNNDVSHDFVITFKDPVGLLASTATSVTCDGDALTQGTGYTIVKGKLTIKAGAIKTAGNHAIVVKSSAYNDAQVNQTIQANAS